MMEDHNEHMLGKSLKQHHMLVWSIGILALVAIVIFIIALMWPTSGAQDVPLVPAAIVSESTQETPQEEPLLVSEHTFYGSVESLADDGSFTVRIESAGEYPETLAVQHTQDTLITSIDTASPPLPGESTTVPTAAATAEDIAEGVAVSVHVADAVNADTSTVTAERIDILY